MTHKESRERRKQIVKLAKTGIPLADVAKQTGASIATVRNACLAGGVRVMTFEQKSKRRLDVANDVKNGVPVDRAAKKYGLCLASIEKACRENGVEPPKNYKAQPASCFKILKMLLDGSLQHDIANKLNITKQRVSQVAIAARKAGFKV